MVVIGSEMTDLYVTYSDCDYDIMKQTAIYLSPKLSATANGINGCLNVGSDSSNRRAGC